MSYEVLCSSAVEIHVSVGGHETATDNRGHPGIASACRYGDCICNSKDLAFGEKHSWVVNPDFCLHFLSC